MRLSVDAGFRLFACGLTAVSLAGCGLTGGGIDRLEGLAALSVADATGPAADYPMVLGEPFTVEGELFTPADTLNYDIVGYAAIDDGAGVTVAHRTLPLPSYVELTSLVSGRTILARVERRGPITGSELVALSPAAAAQLGEGAGAAIRLRRVNPPELDRAELRAGRAAPDRIETPKSLVEVLRRKLPAIGAASLRNAAVAKPIVAAPPAIAAKKPTTDVASAGDVAATGAVTAYPLTPLASNEPVAKPVVVARSEPARVSFRLAGDREGAQRPASALPTPKPTAVSPGSNGDGFVVQAGAYSNQANALRVAKSIGGHVSTSGKLYRVRTGPFTSRGQAEAALAKVRAAGYSDARVYTAG